MFVNISNLSRDTNHTVKIRQVHYDKIIIYSVLFVLSSIGNMSVLIGLLRLKLKKNFQQSKSRIHLLFINLCIGDLMVVLHKLSFRLKILF